MNKVLYTFLNFFLGLTAGCGLLQGIIRLVAGTQILMAESFGAWFLVVNIVSLIGGVLLLKYYHYRKYRVAFFTGVIAIIANLCYAAGFYMLLGGKELVSYYVPLLLLSLGAGIVYAVSLIFSGTGKRSWLKAAGAFMLVIGLVLVSIVIWGQSIGSGKTVEKIVQWTSIAGSLVPVLFMLHFLGELRILKTENAGIPMQRSLENILRVAGVLAFIFVFTFGVMITSDAYSSIYWGKKNFEKTKELARLFEARTFVNSKGDTLLYRLLKPLHYDPAKKYPLVVSLPFGGQPGTDKIRQIEGAAAAEVLSIDTNRRKYPAFLFIPNCPPGSGWGGIPNYPAVDSLVYDAISALDKEFAIDAKRRYVTGISRGGYGSWHFICTRPDMFAAAIPVCGGGDPKLAPKAVNIAVWAFHGKKDKNVPVSGSRDMIAAIKKAGGRPKYTEFSNEGHNIWYQVSITPGLWDWLFAQNRD